MTTAFYSHSFSCLYDEPAPIGVLGRGAHHSVFRSMQSRDINGSRLENRRIHDFAIIWDEDHDTRVISVVERLHLTGLLWPIVFIGERKGVLTIFLPLCRACCVIGKATTSHRSGQLLRIQARTVGPAGWAYSTVPEFWRRGAFPRAKASSTTTIGVS
ncbi:MAG: hypothetical protein FJX54_18165 [Alphaproteobacteria bacterium]|nr:hypothetical protein [Alphaproteobacteria bacterium]